MNARHHSIASFCLVLVVVAACGNGGTTDSDEPVTESEPSDEPVVPSGEGGAPAEAPTPEGPGSAGSANEPTPEGAAGASYMEEPVVDSPSPELAFGPGEVCERADRIGTFSLNLGADRTTFAGTITDAIVPAAVFQQLAEEGSCQLLGPRSLFCDPECESGTTCSGDGSCIPTPENMTVGDVSVSGLLAPLDVSPHPITANYTASILDPFPSFEAGAAIALHATGEDDVGPFTLDGVGIAPMAAPSTVVAIQRDMPAVFTWDAAGADPESSAVYIDITVNPHGSTTGWIECLVEDTGEFEVPAALVTRLVDLGLSGFPRATLGRRSTDGVSLPSGCVDFRISSEVTIDLEVDGLVSCNTNDDCPDAQVCSVELACQDEE